MDPSAIYGIRWVHVFEEDTADGRVYKPRLGTDSPVAAAAARH